MDDKKEILTILDKIINNFSIDNLVRLFQNKTTKFRMLQSRASQPLFTDGLLLGEFDCGDESVCIFTFKTHQPLTERSGKKAQYELAKKMLKEQIRYDGGFFIFYDEQGNFRFSLIYDIPLSSGTREWSNFKRYTYYVGKEQTNKTFIQQMAEADFSSLNSIIKAFSVEKVTREFYNDIANWYFWALQKVQFPKDAEQQSNGRNIALIRFITRIIFVWFMKEKKLISPQLFDFDHIKNILKSTDDNESTYYKAILQNLFFATLNTPIPERKFRTENRFQGKNEDYMNHEYFRYQELFSDPKQDINLLFNEIPFLNGGLFECLDKPKDDPSNDTGNEIRMDGFSDKKENQPIFPNELFFSKEKNVDLTEYYGDTKYKNTRVQGLISILNAYNFTVDENTPLDEEVALDPELLGKVFENLLASYNPETATTARKATGSYYTPREIVDYMVTESLKYYFKTNFENTFPTEKLDEKLTSLFSYSHEEQPFNEKETDFIIEKINELKIIDPAVGSGAFPIGVLNKLVFLLSKLDSHNEKWKAQQFRALDYITDPTLKNELREKIENNFKRNELDYGRKLYLIQNCIYGVDIQPIAIHIAKLRFFISLLVDEKINPNIDDNFGIEPLPNLETKLVAANTLIGLPKSKQLVIKSDETKQIEAELFQIRKQHFTANYEKKKKEIQKRDRELRNRLKELLEESGFPSDYTKKIASWDPYDTNRSADWFDPEWMFGVKKEKKKIQKDWKTFNITWATHNSRRKENYMPSNTEGLTPILLSLEERNKVAQLLAWRIKAKHYRVLAMNVLTDHVHLLLVAEEKDVPKIVGDLKGFVSHEFGAATTHGLSTPTHGSTHDSTHGLTRGSGSDCIYSDGTQQKLWAKHYNNTPVEDFEHFANVIEYINYNHLKHLIPAIDFSLFQDALTPIDKAFEPVEEETGFDIVIGNPPYIQLQKAIDHERKHADLYKDQNFKTFERTGDIYCLFYEKGIGLLKKEGLLCYITSNKWMRAGYGKKLREFFLQYNPKILIDLGPNVFQNTTVDTNILIIQKTENQHQLCAVTITENKKDSLNLSDLLKRNGVIISNLTSDAWFIGSDAEQQLKEKIEHIGKPLKDWDVNIYYGIKTGLNEAFIIDGAKRKEILSNCQDEEERRRTEAIIKPILRGRDIKRYYYEWAGLWVIGTFPALKLNIEDYPALKKYFLDHFDIRQLEQSGKKYPELGFNARKKTTNKWFEVQDTIAYYPEFEKEKIVWAETDQSLNTVIVPKNYYLQKTCFMIIPKDENIIKILNALLNSKISQWYIRNKSSLLGEKGMSLTKESVKEIPLPRITSSNESIVQQVENLVDQILVAKKTDATADTSALEHEIDRLVYQLYNLTEEEIKIIEGEK